MVRTSRQQSCKSVLLATEIRLEYNKKIVCRCYFSSLADGREYFSFSFAFSSIVQIFLTLSSSPSINEKKNIGQRCVHLATRMNIERSIPCAFVIEICSRNSPRRILSIWNLDSKPTDRKRSVRSERERKDRDEGRAALLRLGCSIEDIESSLHRHAPSPHRSISDRGIAE